jgi:hypothetical protein
MSSEERQADRPSPREAFYVVPLRAEDVEEFYDYVAAKGGTCLMLSPGPEARRETDYQPGDRFALSSVVCCDDPECPHHDPLDSSKAWDLVQGMQMEDASIELPPRLPWRGLADALRRAADTEPSRNVAMFYREVGKEVRRLEAVEETVEEALDESVRKGELERTLGRDGEWYYTERRQPRPPHGPPEPQGGP